MNDYINIREHTLKTREAIRDVNKNNSVSQMTKPCMRGNTKMIFLGSW